MSGSTAKSIPVFDHIRFLKFIRIDKVTKCWEWQGSVSKGKKAAGYGIMYFHIPKTRRHLAFKAHRVSYDIFVGITDLSKVIDHTCMNKICCNPSHLREVTRKVNALENSNSASALNSKKFLCPKGHEYTGNDKGRRRCLVCKYEAKKVLSLL